MWKKTIMRLLKKLLILLAVSLVFLGAETGIAFYIYARYHSSLQDVMTMMGIVVGGIGILATMKGASSGASFGGMGSNVGDMAALGNLQHVRLEREGDSYAKNFFRNGVVEYGLFRMAFLLSGLMLLLCSWIFF